MRGWFQQGILLVVVAGIAGCGEFFSEKPTVLESRSIINDINRVSQNPYTRNPLPDIYLEAPKKINVSDGVKVLYFTRNLPCGDLAANVGQLGLKVSSNSSTNQLIVHCSNEEQADRLIEYLRGVDVPPIQVNIDCLILERFGDVTTDWETTLLIENLLGEGITIGADKYPNSAFPGASLRESKRGEFGLDFGYWADKGVSGHQLRFIVDMLESRGYLKVLMNPTIETVNGKTATVRIKDIAPIQVTVTGKGAEIGKTFSYQLTQYQPVEDVLTVTPYVFSDGYIGLNTSIVVGSKSKPEGIVQNPILTKRTIDVAENRIEPGKSLVIGGIKKAENRSVVRGVPFLKDIPIIGVLFSSKDFEERANEIVFILTPTISSGGSENSKMVDFIREKHAAPEYQTGMTDFFSDPFGTGLYTELVEQEALKAEAERSKAETDRILAERLSQSEKKKAQDAQLQAAGMKVLARQAALDAQKAKEDAQQAQSLAEQARIRAKEQKSTADNVLVEKEKALAQAQKVKQEADTAQKNAQEAIEKAKTQEQKARADEERARQAAIEAEKAVLEAKKAQENAQKARENAEKAKEQLKQAESSLIQPQSPPPSPPQSSSQPSLPSSPPSSVSPASSVPSAVAGNSPASVGSAVLSEQGQQAQRETIGK